MWSPRDLRDLVERDRLRAAAMQLHRLPDRGRAEPGEGDDRRRSLADQLQPYPQASSTFTGDVRTRPLTTAGSCSACRSNNCASSRLAAWTLCPSMASQAA